MPVLGPVPAWTPHPCIPPEWLPRPTRLVTKDPPSAPSLLLQDGGHLGVRGQGQLHQLL